MKMAKEVRKLYSQEWQALFTELEGKGYTISYDGGVILIRSTGHRMNVSLERGRWQMELFKPFMLSEIRRSRYDSQIIEQVRYWIDRAQKSPLLYSFALRETA
ncbi:hypothetical protein CIG75_12890 [Tumebacillus algifaecis]|uniref:Uncharacterized protein n=1 Tax=Tumebacillus algifaecis TaxID=1214604 RepID=A0A223D2R8_9BACL|nr:hypothetical protein [Tumebacillus algifaecis]ASS75795.1 hypothetical protein CIG75_12890 [Tumebacillus algifaecis]